MIFYDKAGLVSSKSFYFVISANQIGFPLNAVLDILVLVSLQEFVNILWKDFLTFSNYLQRFTSCWTFQLTVQS